MDASLVRWPDDQPRRERLADAAEPRLLLLADGVEPPIPVDCLEDWIRLPASELDVAVRLEALGRRARAHGATARPDVDADGVLRLGRARVPLAPVDARLAAALVSRLGSVVTREALSRAGWPHGAPERNVLDVHVLRLRRRLETVGLVIRTVRSRGYLLEAP